MPIADDDSNDALQHHASGFVVRTEGVFSAAWIAYVRRFLNARGLHPSAEGIDRVLSEVRDRHFRGDSCVYVCNAHPCSGRLGFEVSDEALARRATKAGVSIVTTGCQGQCKQAPVVAVRVGHRSALFGQIATEADQDIVLEFAREADRARSLVSPRGAIDRYRIDPAHDHGESAAQLAPVEFLLGHFRGEGRFAAGGYEFYKECVGAYEAGGRIIALRMGASYPMPQGGNDVHRALVIVGSQPRSGRLVGHAYTDGGEVREYALEQAERSVTFDDVAPDHAQRWTRVRKTLSPTNEGYEECLEVDRGNGFVPYYTVTMRRAATSAR